MSETQSFGFLFFYGLHLNTLSSASYQADMYMKRMPADRKTNYRTNKNMSAQLRRESQRETEINRGSP